MAETSSAVTRHQESFQLPKQNGKIDAGLGTVKKGVNDKSPNAGCSDARARMTKQNIAPKNLRTPSAEDKNAAESTKAVICNGTTPDLQSVTRTPTSIGEDFLQSPTPSSASSTDNASSSSSHFPMSPNGDVPSTLSPGNHRILEVTLSTPPEKKSEKKSPSARSHFSTAPTCRRGDMDNPASNQILHLKGMIQSQLTAMQEQQLQIEQQKKLLKEYKDENEMLKLKLERSERRMTNLKGRTASGRPIARGHLFDPFVTPSEPPPTKAALTSATARSQQQRPKNRLMQPKRKGFFSSEPILIKKARIAQSHPAAPTPTHKSRTPSNSFPAPSFNVPVDHAYVRESTEVRRNVEDIEEEPLDDEEEEEEEERPAAEEEEDDFLAKSSISLEKNDDRLTTNFTRPHSPPLDDGIETTFPPAAPSSSSSSSSSNHLAVFPSREEARHAGSEADEQLRASSRSPALSSPSPSVSKSATLTKNSTAVAGAFEKSKSPLGRDSSNDSTGRRTQTVTSTERDGDDDDDDDVDDGDDGDSNVGAKKNDEELEDDTETQATSRSKTLSTSTTTAATTATTATTTAAKKSRVSSGGSGSVTQLLDRFSSSSSERVVRRGRMMGPMQRLQSSAAVVHPTAVAAACLSTPKKVQVGAELENFARGPDCQIASTANPGNDGDFIFRSDELYPFFVGDPEYFQGELSPKKTDKEQVEAPRYRVTAAPTFAEPDKKTVKAEVESLNDDAYLNRHKKGEVDEKRRKRWDIQRIRELRNNERLKMGKHSGYSASWSDPNKKSDEVDGRAISTFFPDPDEISFIQVADTVPVCAFGTFLPNVSWNLFKVPWTKKELNFLFPPTALSSSSSSSHPSTGGPRRNATSAFSAAARHLIAAKSNSSSSVPKILSSSKRKAFGGLPMKSVKGRHSYSSSCQPQNKRLP